MRRSSGSARSEAPFLSAPHGDAGYPAHGLRPDGFALTGDVSTADAAHQLLPHELAAQIVQTDRVAIARRAPRGP